MLIVNRSTLLCILTAVVPTIAAAQTPGSPPASTTDLRFYAYIVSAFLGFLSGTVVKHWFDRRRDRLLEADGKKKLAIELLGELRFIGAELLKLQDELNRVRSPGLVEIEPPDYKSAFRIPATPAFDACLGELGKLDVKTVSLVVEVFYSVRSLERVSAPLKGVQAESFGVFNDCKENYDRCIDLLSPKIAELDRCLSTTAEVPGETEAERERRALGRTLPR